MVSSLLASQIETEAFISGCEIFTVLEIFMAAVANLPLNPKS